MLIVLCSNGDNQSATYKKAEQAFVERTLLKKPNIPNSTSVRTFVKPGASLPDVNNKPATQAFLFALLSRMKIDPNMGYKAELYKDGGYTFVVFYLGN